MTNNQIPTTQNEAFMWSGRLCGAWRWNVATAREHLERGSA